jgi:hypothetical protein
MGSSWDNINQHPKYCSEPSTVYRYLANKMVNYQMNQYGLGAVWKWGIPEENPPNFKPLN